eukprot:CAMPEP_0177368820 /NCGR_PEP_ID=MMETSP0368-20130122/41134_1 /TAXON_ID=447022 ORGANISM="Scrippsiella hangoei-like, Strain SHHI-4" /NCGR_SAMPLE_ID=MMETSP0368 /ASSEMBLY_ACC=CAM_ASM_000363 /LENGTH=189 /DNA_ID=CAMNT_0018831987 /DNA_START=293 /DNA_END=864 /DNA_ORIENTATION=-
MTSSPTLGASKRPTGRSAGTCGARRSRQGAGRASRSVDWWLCSRGSSSRVAMVTTTPAGLLKSTIEGGSVTQSGKMTWPQALDFDDVVADPDLSPGVGDRAPVDGDVAAFHAQLCLFSAQGTGFAEEPVELVGTFDMPFAWSEAEAEREACLMLSNLLCGAECEKDKAECPMAIDLHPSQAHGPDEWAR